MKKYNPRSHERRGSESCYPTMERNGRNAQVAAIRRRRGTWVKGPKTVNHPHQVGLGELLSMASTRLRGEVGGPIGLTKPTNKKLLIALLARPAIML
jgi:hypothetical protein